MLNGKAVNTVRREKHINKYGGIRGKQEEFGQK